METTTSSLDRYEGTLKTALTEIAEYMGEQYPLEDFYDQEEYEEMVNEEFMTVTENVLDPDKRDAILEVLNGKKGGGKTKVLNEMHTAIVEHLIADTKDNMLVTEIELDGWNEDAGKYLFNATVRRGAWRREDYEDIAYVSISGEVEFINGFNRDNVPDIDKEISRWTESYLFSSKMDELRESLVKEVMRGNGAFLPVRTVDGRVDYAIEQHDILGGRYMCAGMYEHEEFRSIPYRQYASDDKKREDAESLVDWLIEDIISAVGEEFVIEWD